MAVSKSALILGWLEARTLKHNAALSHVIVLVFLMLAKFTPPVPRHEANFVIGTLGARCRHETHHRAGYASDFCPECTRGASWGSTSDPLPRHRTSLSSSIPCSTVGFTALADTASRQGQNPVPYGSSGHRNTALGRTIAQAFSLSLPGRIAWSGPLGSMTGLFREVGHG